LLGDGKDEELSLMGTAAGERAAALAREIEAAFAEVRYPGDDRLVYDSTGKHLECAEVAAALRGRHWRELSVEELSYSPSNLHFMTPDAIHYYLPAYLKASVLSYHEAAAVPETLLFILKSPQEADADGRQGSFADRLTRGQKTVVRSFLEFLRDEHGADFPWEEVSPSTVLEAWR